MEQMLKRIENLLLKYRIGSRHFDLITEFGMMLTNNDILVIEGKIFAGRCVRIEPEEIADMIFEYLTFDGILNEKILKDEEIKGKVKEELSAGLYISF